MTLENRRDAGHTIDLMMLDIERRARRDDLMQRGEVRARIE